MVLPLRRKEGDMTGTDLTKRENKTEKKIDQIMELAGDSPELRAKAFHALTEYKRSQVVRAGAAAVASLSWGANLSPAMRVEVARYALSQGTDPLRHWEVLGGKLYDRAELWMDLITAEPDYLGCDEEYIHDDKRLDSDERKRRQQERAKYGVPEDVKGACVVTLHFDGKRPIVGVNWAGTYGFSKSNGQQGMHLDPVGDENPTKTCATRAWRKAAKRAKPLYFRRTKAQERDQGVPLAEIQRVEEKIERERESAKRQEEEYGPERPEPVDVGGLGIKGGSAHGAIQDLPDDGYGLDDEDEERARAEDAEME